MNIVQVSKTDTTVQRPKPILHLNPEFVGSDGYLEANYSLVLHHYLYSLYQIEALRYARLDNVDLMLAWQYGHKFNTPWKDNRYLVQEFKDHNHTTLRKFVGYKLFHMMENLVLGLKNFEELERMYIPLPMTQAERQSIASNLNEVITDNNLERSFMHEHEVTDVSRASITAHYRGAYMGLELADRLLVGIHDTYTEKHTEELRHWYDEGKYPNDMLTMCKHKLYEKLLKPLFLTPEPIRQQKYYDHYGLWACLFSILYRLQVPAMCYSIRRLDKIYDDAITERRDAVIWARKYSSLPIEAVIGSSMEDIELCPCLIQDTVVDTGSTLAAIYPDGLTEKYLATQKIFTDSIYAGNEV